MNIIKKFKKFKNNVKDMPSKFIRGVVKAGLTARGINFFILFVTVGLFFIYKYINDIDFVFSDFIDSSTVVAVMLVFICNIIAYPISNWFGKKYEDQMKLSNNYDAIVKKYNKEKLLTYKSKTYPIIELKTIKENEKFNLIIDDSHSDNKYVLPTQASIHSDEIFCAHKKSNTYNNMNVRLDSIVFEGNNVRLLYSNTTYYDSLVTNRAIDYICSNGMTIREIYEPGPYLSSLEDSRLSNHIGFNGFIKIEKESKFIFVKRDKDVSVGKDTLSPSVAASMKVKYCYDNKKLTYNGIINSIKNEIKDELKIDFNDEELHNCIFAFYRDVIEGGKPQFLFYLCKSDLTINEFEDKFKKEYKKSKKSDVDGTEFRYYTYEEIKNSLLMPGLISIGNDKTERFKMTPSAQASIILLMKHFEK